MTSRVIALDFEHTDHHIFQIGAYCLGDHDTFCHSVNPERPLNQFALEKTGFTDAELVDSPTWVTVGPMWFSWLRSKVKEGETLVFLGHNFNGSEVKCLKTSFVDYPETLKICPDFVRDANVIDTLTIAKRLGMKDNQQENVYQRLFEKSPERAHDALDDAKCCAEIAQHELFRPMWDSVRGRMGGNSRVNPKWVDYFRLKDTVPV
jgi:DNA polymerase III epsilon subunit-like protein